MLQYQKSCSTLFATSICLVLAACSNDDSSTGYAETPAPTITSLPVPEVRPNYDEEEDGTYFYVGVVSEEDEKRGKAVGPVVAFRYLGKNDKDQHVLVSVNDAGQSVMKSTCSEPCKIIRYEDGGRTPFSSQSIIGSAFQDAINGKLKSKPEKAVKSQPVYPQFVSSVPKVFRGAWDEMVQDGCQGREVRFAIEPTQFFNFEVQWDVTKVKLYSAEEADIYTSTKDEDGGQIDEVWEFKLVDNGKSLTSRKPGGSYFRRCPT